MANATEPAINLVIIGSGAAGLTAAVMALAQELSVRARESSDLIGSTTALSGSMIWASNTPKARQIADAPKTGDAARVVLAYLRATAGNHFDKARVAAFLAAVGTMLGLVRQRAGLDFALNSGSCNNVPDAAEATLGRRALNPVPMAARGMRRALFAQLRPPLGTMMLLGGMSVASGDLHHFQNVVRRPASALVEVRRVAACLRDWLTGWQRSTDLANGGANGGAIVATLAKGWPGWRPSCRARPSP